MLNLREINLDCMDFFICLKHRVMNNSPFKENQRGSYRTARGWCVLISRYKIKLEGKKCSFQKNIKCFIQI